VVAKEPADKWDNLTVNCRGQEGRGASEEEKAKVLLRGREGEINVRKAR